MFHCFIAYFIFYFIIIIIIFFLHFPLSGPVLTYISLLIIPCMIVYVTNNKEPWTLICLIDNIKNMVGIKLYFTT